jgi:membrane protein implicated in regulation of membrane protease activity
MIGEVATVVETVAGRQRPDVRGNGHVRILGEDWPAASSDDSVLSPGTLVQIIDIEGSTLVVERTARIGGVAAPPAFS